MGRNKENKSRIASIQTHKKITITKEPLKKTTTQKVKRYEELKVLK